jgi:hypothetical protein
MPRFDRLLLTAGLAHVVLAVVCVALLWVDAPRILGVHPALKPLKFAMSIGIFLVTMAVLLPVLSISDATRRLLSGALALTMIVEMAIIATQALRGRRSHFNLEQPFDAALTTTMMAGIAVLLLTMVTITLLATVRPIAQPALVTAAWRAALWIFLLATVSGMAMGARGGHTIGGADGGPGMAVTNWSTAHGDLRVSHFFALHALQIIPLLALAISWLALPVRVQWALLVLGIAANALLVGWTWLQALASRPAW